MKHTLSCLVRNEPGVLGQVAESFGRDRINISSLAVGTTENADVARMTIVIEGTEEIVAHAERVVTQLPGVLRLEDLNSKEFFSRELLLVKVAVEPASVGRIMQMAEMFDARVIGVTQRTMTLELAADDQRIEAMLKLLKPLTIVSIARSGRIAVSAEEET
jgi:acetolactate synthase-1/3 small subunit